MRCLTKLIIDGILGRTISLFFAARQINKIDPLRSAANLKNLTQNLLSPNKLVKSILLCMPFVFSSIAQAQTVEPLQPTRYGSFLYFEQIPNALFFFGAIERSDSFEFRKAIRTHPIDTVVLGSPGGSVWEGLSMAGIIYDKKLRTYVPKGSECASACSFMYFAGQPRHAGGKVGVHQFYSGNDKVDEGKTNFESQFTVSEIIGFLNEFNTPPFVFERMFSQKEMYYFTAKEMEEINSTSYPEPDTGVVYNEIDQLMERLIAEFENDKKIGRASCRESV